MSVFSEAVAAVQSALKLSDELRRTSQELKDVALELRDHDRCITAWKRNGRRQPYFRGSGCNAR
jgi:hypothetical protein